MTTPPIDKTWLANAKAIGRVQAAGPIALEKINSQSEPAPQQAARGADAWEVHDLPETSSIDQMSHGGSGDATGSGGLGKPADGSMPKANGGAQRWANIQQVLTAMEPARDQVGDCVLHVNTGRRVDVLKVGSQQCQDHVAFVLKETLGAALGGPIPASLMQQCEQHLRIEAGKTGKRLAVCTRVMMLDGNVLVDRNDAEGHVLRHSAKGWTDAAEAEAPFARSFGLGTIPAPVRPVSTTAAAATLIQFAKRLGVPQNNRRIFLAALLCSWWPVGPYPIMNFVGAAGSGKSTAANIVSQLLDPSESGELRNMKLTREDLAAAAQCYHVLSIDNVSRLDADQSDLLCTVASGGEVITRKLYTNGDTCVMRLKNPLIVTSIHPIALRGDLQSRTLTFEISHAGAAARRSEEDVLTEFRLEQPALVGAMAELLCAALAKLADVKAQELRINHRLTDFVLLGEAMLQALGKPAGEFLAEMDATKARAAAEAAAGDGFIATTRSVLDRLARDAVPGEALPGRRQWHTAGTCAVIRGDGRLLVGVRLIRLMQLLQTAQAPGGVRGDGWKPKTERECGQAIVRSMPTWTALGYEVIKGGSYDRSHYEFLLPVAPDPDVNDEHGGTDGTGV